MRRWWIVGLGCVVLLGCHKKVVAPVPMELPALSVEEQDAAEEPEEATVQPFVIPAQEVLPRNPIATIQRANQQALIQPRPSDFVNAVAVLRYCFGCRYLITVAEYQPVTVMFQPGEEIKVFALGEMRFNPQRSKDVDPESVTFTPWREKLKGRATIVTTRGVYALELQSHPTTGLAFVSFKHPEERQVTAKANGTYGVGYGVPPKPAAATYTPLFAWNDKRHTYLLFPERMWVTGVPTIHVRRGERSHLVNYQTFAKQSVFKVNRLLGDGEAFELGLTPGEETAVQVLKTDTFHDISCPGHEACEVIQRYTPRVPRRRTAAQGG